jgi:ABC-type transport system involved in multi-copper enzyme maturation permease subunit
MMQTKQRLRSQLKAEWIKLRSVPYGYILLLLSLLLTLALAVVAALSVRSIWPHLPPSLRAAFDPTSNAIAGIQLGQFLLAVFAALTFTSEISSGTIIPTLLATPRRSYIIAAKTILVFLSAFITAELTTFASFFLGQSLVSGVTPTANLGQPGVLRAVLGTGFFVTFLSMFAFGVATILRRSAASITVFVVIALILPAIVDLVPTSWAHTVSRLLPLHLEQSVFSPHPPTPHDYSAVSSIVIMAIYALVAIVIGLWRTKRLETH